MKKAFLSITLAAILAASTLLSACGTSGAESTSKPADNTATSGTSTEQSGVETTGEKTDISLAIWVATGVDDDNQLETRLMEKNPDVNFSLIALERSSWQEQINTRVAGGDIPDIIYRDSPGLVSEFAKQGIIAEVPMEMIREHAPDIFAASQDFPVEVWLAARYQDVNYGIPIMQPNVSTPFSNHWRMDMLEAVGETKIPETLEEAEAVFEKIIATDFNGSGKNDTFAFSWPGKSSSKYMFSDIFAAFGVMPDKWMIQEDGTVKWAFATEEAGEAVALLHDWYSRGFIDPEFVTTDASIYLQKIAAGNIAMHTWASWGRAQPPQGEFYAAAISGNPDARLEVGPPLKGPNGDSGYPTWGPITSSVTFGSHLAKDEAKLIKCISLINSISSNTDDAEYVRYGTEGTDWVRDPNTNAKVSLHMDDPTDRASFADEAINAIAGVPAFQARYDRSDDAEYKRFADTGTVLQDTGYVNWISRFTNSEVTTEIGDITTDLEKALLDMIVGNRPITDFDQVIEDWYANGGTALTEENSRAYQAGLIQLAEQKEELLK